MLLAYVVQKSRILYDVVVDCLQNTCTYRDRQSQAKGKSQGQMTRSQLQRLDCSNNQSSATPQELSIYTGGGLEFSEAEFPVLGNGKTGSSGSPPPPLSYLSRWKTPHGSSSNDSWPHDEVVEPWPINPEPCDATIPEASSSSSSSSPLEQVVTSDLQGSSSSGIGSSATEGLKRDDENNQERSDLTFKKFTKLLYGLVLIKKKKKMAFQGCCCCC